MKLSRRNFVGSIGVGAAASLLSGTALVNRSAFAQTRKESHSKIYDGGVIQLNQNESARGPGPKTLEALHSHVNKRLGRGYSPDHVVELEEVLAAYYGVTRDNVLLATGSSPLLEGSTRAFCNAERAIVAAAPTYSTSEGTARRIGAPIKHVIVDPNGEINLDNMAAAASGAGLVYFCNPNNPTGTVHGPLVVEQFVRRVMAENPETVVHLDEAYIDYVDPSVMKTALPLALEFPNVFITRSFSKAHGMAGLRVGYALGQKATLDKIRAAWGMGDINMLAAIGAITAFEDREHIAWEREENTQIRAMTVAAFENMGFQVAKSHTNHIFVNLRRPARDFRAACLAEKVLVGRDFPPLENTHCRISLGSREEMATAIEVFKRVLG